MFGIGLGAHLLQASQEILCTNNMTLADPTQLKPCLPQGNPGTTHLVHLHNNEVHKLSRLACSNSTSTTLKTCKNFTAMHPLRFRDIEGERAKQTQTHFFMQAYRAIARTQASAGLRACLVALACAPRHSSSCPAFRAPAPTPRQQTGDDQALCCMQSPASCHLAHTLEHAGICAVYMVWQGAGQCIRKPTCNCTKHQGPASASAAAAHGHTPLRRRA